MTLTTTKNKGPQAFCMRQLKSCEPDLVIILGQGAEKSTRHLYSMFLASHSEYIDAALASPMREGRTKQLTFPDIDTPTWDRMMQFITDPVDHHGSKMTVKDARDLAPFYDKYDFGVGRKLCDKVMAKYFGRLKEQGKDDSLDLDNFADMVETSFLANLTVSRSKAVDYLKWLFTKHPRPRYGPQVLQAPHIRKLVPALIQLVEMDPTLKILPCPYPSAPNSSSLTAEEIQSSLFPRLYSREWEAKLSRSHGAPPAEILVSVTGRMAALLSGKYEKFSSGTLVYLGTRPVELDGVLSIFGVSRYIYASGLQRWEITARPADDDNDGREGKNAKLFYYSPFNPYICIPPKNGWNPVHALAKGAEVSIKYSRNE